MKIGIITLIGNNYGNRLQNYAVQEILKQYGEVYTVPYEKKTGDSQRVSCIKKLNPFYIKKAIDSRLLNLYHLSNRNLNTFARLLYFLKHRDEMETAFKNRERAFKKFDDTYIQYEEERLHLQGDDTEPWVQSYDAWVCGSDQIWNPNYPTATRNAFLQFAQQERRVSFSASIGLSDINAMPSVYKEWIEEIPYLSVREHAAAEIVKGLTGRSAQVLLDPTMLLPTEYWYKMADTAKVQLPQKYALCYFLGIREKQYDYFIKQYIREHNLESIELLNSEHLEYFSYGPAEMVAAIRNAEVVFVDSFHGAVFSILFQKPFVVFERREEGLTMNSRLQTLLKTFHMEQRVFDEKNKMKLYEPVDYATVEEILQKEREKAKEFLDHAMSEIGKMEKVEKTASSKRIEITKKEHCFGCGACSQACPKQCIQMVSDEEGFLYPEIDTDTCINCGKCISVCPYYHREGKEIQDVYAAINYDKMVRSESSSGGTFYQICKKTIEDGGVVFGCAFDESMTAVHIKVNWIENIRRLQGSKYVQSYLGDTYKEVKKELTTGKSVVFSGTPCQVAGLKNYLGKDYDNLFLVDVLCHGVPSPKVLKAYQETIEAKYGSKITYMNVRDKKKSWHRLHTEIHFADGQQFYTFCGYDTYMSMFLTNISQRPSCFECKFTTKRRQGDITLGDFWGVGIHISEMDDDKGTSMVAVNTEKGTRMWNDIRKAFKVVKSDFATAESGNKVLSIPPKKNPKREGFYKTFVEEGYTAAAEKWIEIPSKPKQIYYDVMRKGLDFYRWLFKKKY